MPGRTGTPSAPIELISFDADQTLFDFDKTLKEALAALSAHLAERHGFAATVDQLQATRNRVAAQHKAGAIPLLTIRRRALQEGQ